MAPLCDASKVQNLSRLQERLNHPRHAVGLINMREMPTVPNNHNLRTRHPLLQSLLQLRLQISPQRLSRTLTIPDDGAFNSQDPHSPMASELLDSEVEILLQPLLHVPPHGLNIPLWISPANSGKVIASRVLEYGRRLRREPAAGAGAKVDAQRGSRCGVDESGGPSVQGDDFRDAERGGVRLVLSGDAEGFESDGYGHAVG